VIVNRYGQLLAPLQFLWFVLCLSTPAYLFATKALKSAGIGLAWYHHVALALLSLLLVAAVTMLLCAVMSVAFGIVRLVRPSYGRRA
jgi:hypothetical protein